MSPSEKIDAIRVSPTATVRETMNTINEAAGRGRGAPVGIALVLDNEDRLCGVVTDGDIRKALVNGHTVDHLASDVMVDRPITVPPGLSPAEMIDRMTRSVRASAHIRDTKVEYLIVADEARRVVDIVRTLDLYNQLDVTSRTVGVTGLGFVGLTLAVSLADVGFQVYGIDLDEQTVEAIRTGRPHFHERGLEPLLRYQLQKERFLVRTELPDHVDIHIVAVGTPIGADGRPRLDHVRSATESIAKTLKRGDLVLLRSTVPVGTTRDFVGPLLEAGSGLRCGVDFDLAFAPERTVEGNALKELRNLPQIVGGVNTRSREAAARFFAKLAPNIIRVDSLEAAEMVKLVNNSFRDLSFAFANELALICDRWNLDAVRVIEAANTGYPRNPVPLPSPGVGGFCLTKDPLIYAWAGREKGYTPRLPVDGRAINEQIVERVGEKILAFFARVGRPTEGAKVLVMGFAFKGLPETSDMRHSTTLDLLPTLRDAGMDLYGYDPVVPDEEIERLGIRPVEPEDGFRDAVAVVVMNNHPSYVALDLFELLSAMDRPALFFDGWHLFDRDEVEQFEGITYEGLSGAR